MVSGFKDITGVRFKYLSILGIVFEKHKTSVSGYNAKLRSLHVLKYQCSVETWGLLHIAGEFGDPSGVMHIELGTC